jgi:hypothetical protein
MEMAGELAPDLPHALLGGRGAASLCCPASRGAVADAGATDSG